MYGERQKTRRNRAAAGIVLLLTGGLAGAYENGAPPGHTGGFGEPDCGLCHADHPANGAEGRLEIQGLPRDYEPEASYTLIVLLEHPSLESGGFQLAVRDTEGEPAGRWQIVPDGLQVVSRDDQPYLQHARSDRERAEDGRLRWTATWRAPAERKPLVLHVAANAANDDLSALGDRIFLRELAISAAENGTGGR